MDEYIKKIGIYDFFVLVGSGGIMLFVCWLINCYYDIISIDVLKGLYEKNITLLIILLIIASVLIGVITQELGSIISNNLIWRNDRLLHKAFNSSSFFYKRYTISNQQCKDIADYLGIAYDETNLDNVAQAHIVIYHKCKYLYKTQFDAYDIDHDQALSSMSRSLSLFFFSVPFFLMILGKGSVTCSFIITSLLSLLLATLFLERFVRFAIIRYSEIIKRILYMRDLPNLEKSIGQRERSS